MTVIRPYVKLSLLILIRYQQIYIYLPGIALLILMPIVFSIKAPYFNMMFSFFFLIIIWLFSPFFLCMFSFSPEDARSLSLFPIWFKSLIAARNILNSIILLIAFSMLILLMFFFYPKTNTGPPELIVLSVMQLFPVISIGNLTSRSALFWTGKTTYSWKAAYIILILHFNIMIIKISQSFFCQPVSILIIATIFMFYIGIYYLSFQKIVKDIFIFFCSIAEN